MLRSSSLNGKQMSEKVREWSGYCGRRSRLMVGRYERVFTLITTASRVRKQMMIQSRDGRWIDLQSSMAGQGDVSIEERGRIRRARQVDNLFRERWSERR
jgi:butyrate kinase